MKTINSFEKIDAIHYVCQEIKKALESDILEFENATLILTGGSTIQPFLAPLSELDIEWSKVSIILSDERWVSLDDERSNEKQLHNHFLSKLKTKPKYFRLKTEHKTPNDALTSLEKELSFVKFPLSISLLSMGADGHVASLFPGYNWDGLVNCCEYNGEKKVSLGIECFKNCKKNIVLLSEDRISILKKLEKDTNSTYPLSAFNFNLLVIR